MYQYLFLKKDYVDPTTIILSRADQNGNMYLTDANGITLYTFSEDKELESVCSRECLKDWPIFEYDNKNMQAVTHALSKNVNVIDRADGFLQFAYGKQPLYYYKFDAKPGDMRGHNWDNKWSIVLVNQ